MIRLKHPSKPDPRTHERGKYEGIYSASDKYPRYGHSNHGRRAVQHIATKVKPESILDVGCGYNEFNKDVKNNLQGVSTVGVDFACPGADVNCSAEAMPFNDKQFDLVTSFDMLEHLLPEQVEPVLNEMARVSKRFFFSISYVPSVTTWQGENLHPTVHHENWWILKIMKCGGMNVRKHENYITGDWKDNLKLHPECNIILVGNGPALLGKGHGDIIDSFDEVVRFNLADTGGKYTVDTGAKTTMWSTFGKGTACNLPETPKKVIYIHGEDGHPGVDAEVIYRLPRWYFGQVKSAEASFAMFANGLLGDPWRPTSKRELIPSSGLLVASWLLQVIEVKKIILAGFDHFGKNKSQLHHYWVDKRYGKPKEHDGDIEGIIFKHLEEHGRVQYIDDYIACNKL